MIDPVGMWLTSAIFAKLCGATDPAAVVEAAVKEWGPFRNPATTTPEDYLGHIRLIQRLAEEQVQR